jgi:tetratricopeptide (TPR) repeat protein
MNTQSTPPFRTARVRSRGFWLALGLIFAVSALIRGLYLAEIEGNPEVHGPRLDGLYHHYWARALVTGDWTPPPGESDPAIPATAYFRPPGYPWFLAALYRIFGTASLGMRVAQMAIGLATLVCAAFLARRFGGPGAGLVAAALLAGFWAPVYYEGCWLETAPLTLLLLGSAALVYAWPGPVSLARALGAGAALGLAGLIRPNAFLLVPVFLIRIAFGASGATRSVWIRSTGFLLLSVGMILFPLARNRIRGGEWVPVSTNAGINLLLGTERSATLSHGNWMTGDWSCFDAPELARRVSDQEGRTLLPGEASRELSRMAWEIHRSDPAGALRLAVWKVLLFCAPGEVSNNGEEEIERQTSPILRRFPVSFPLLLGLGAAGFLLWLLDSRREPGGAAGGWGFLLVTLVYTGSFIPFVIAGQYRVPLAPFLAVAAGVGLNRAWRLWRSGRRLGFALAVAGFAGCVGMACANPVQSEPDWARWHYMRGQMYARAGQTKLEEGEYLSALALAPDREEVLLNLGILYYEQKAPRAGDVLRRVQQIQESAMADLYLGRLALDAGDMGRALAHFEASAALNPDAPDAPYRQGLVRMELGQPLAAAEAFTRALTIDPGFREARFGLGWALLEGGRAEEAWAVFEELSRGAPVPMAVWYQGGRALLAMGRVAEARQWWAAYLRNVPDDEEVRDEWERFE